MRSALLVVLLASAAGCFGGQAEGPAGADDHRWGLEGCQSVIAWPP